MRNRQRGITLLEMMVVLSIIAIVMGLVIAPTIMERYRSSQRQTAKLTVLKYAEQDYPVWQMSHPSKACPERLGELSGARSTEDPWGSEYRMHCGDSAPTTTAFGASSLAEDRRPNTDDDIVSWD